MCRRAVCTGEVVQPRALPLLGVEPLETCQRARPRSRAARCARSSCRQAMTGDRVDDAVMMLAVTVLSTSLSAGTAGWGLRGGDACVHAGARVVHHHAAPVRVGVQFGVRERVTTTRDDPLDEA